MLENIEVMIGNWVMRLHRPAGKGSFPVLLMLHGWTGDENSMWVFSSKLPNNMMVIAPRGLFRAANDGFSWHPQLSHTWPEMNDFLPAIKEFLTMMTEVNLPGGDFSSLHLLGFSQGTALAYALAIMYPEKVTSVSGLSGFLPEGAYTWLQEGRLTGMPIFVAHGTQDELVPVGKARLSVELLERAGAAVTYCEDDVGHKLSAKCFHGLEAFYQRVSCQ